MQNNNYITTALQKKLDNKYNNSSKPKYNYTYKFNYSYNRNKRLSNTLGRENKFPKNQLLSLSITSKL